MEKEQVIGALAALAQESRLDMFRLLVRAGPGGMAAGQVGAAGVGSAILLRYSNIMGMRLGGVENAF